MGLAAFNRARALQAQKDKETKKDADGGMSKFDGMGIEDLKAYAFEHSIDIGNATSLKGILGKILKAEE